MNKLALSEEELQLLPEWWAAAGNYCQDDIDYYCKLALVWQTVRQEPVYPHPVIKQRLAEHCRQAVATLASYDHNKRGSIGIALHDLWLIRLAVPTAWWERESCTQIGTPRNCCRQTAGVLTEETLADHRARDWACEAWHVSVVWPHYPAVIPHVKQRIVEEILWDRLHQIQHADASYIKSEWHHIAEAAISLRLCGAKSFDEQLGQAILRQPSYARPESLPVTNWHNGQIEDVVGDTLLRFWLESPILRLDNGVMVTA